MFTLARTYTVCVPKSLETITIRKLIVELYILNYSHLNCQKSLEQVRCAVINCPFAGFFICIYTLNEGNKIFKSYVMF